MNKIMNKTSFITISLMMLNVSYGSFIEEKDDSLTSHFSTHLSTGSVEIDRLREQERIAASPYAPFGLATREEVQNYVNRLKSIKGRESDSVRYQKRLDEIEETLRQKRLSEISAKWAEIAQQKEIAKEIKARQGASVLHKELARRVAERKEKEEQREMKKKQNMRLWKKVSRDVLNYIKQQTANVKRAGNEDESSFNMKLEALRRESKERKAELLKQQQAEEEKVEQMQEESFRLKEVPYSRDLRFLTRKNTENINDIPTPMSSIDLLINAEKTNKGGCFCTGSKKKNRRPNIR